MLIPSSRFTTAISGEDARLRLLVVGAGAQARYVIETARSLDEVVVIGLVDTFDNRALWGHRIEDIEIVGGVDVLDRVRPEPDLRVVLAVADRDHKRSLAAQLSDSGHVFEAVIHPRAIIAHTATVAAGCIINAGVVVESGARIDAHAIVHSGTVIEHDVVVEEFANVGPGVTTAGRVRIGPGAIIYSGATLIPNVTIGRDAIVGAGSVVLADVPEAVTVAGVPARILTRNPRRPSQDRD